MSGVMNPSSLASDLGGTWHRYYGVAPCPVCQPERRRDQNALTITAKDEKLLLHCKKSGCEFRSILTAAGIIPGQLSTDAQFQAEADHQREARLDRQRERARHILKSSVNIRGTAGEAYFRGRGITCALPGSLRWLNETFHGPTGQNCGAIVAEVTPTGGVHRTFFDKGGQRLPRSAKLMLGPCSGGAVRLSDGAEGLVVCEGIETGLSLLSGLLSGPHTVWAALSTSGMKGLHLPKSGGKLIIASDGDDAGRDAAMALARRAYASDWHVALMEAPEGKDWNDVLRREVAA